MSRRGSTIIEMLLVTLLTAIIIGTLASLYGFSMGRAAHSAARYAALDQANTLADRIEATVQQAVTCTIVTSGSNSGLKCTMPSSGVDRDGDGYIDRYSPISVTRRGAERFGYGKRVWFYDSDSTGDFLASGTIMWRAERADDSLPTTSDRDQAFAYYYAGSTPRFNLVTSATLSVDASAQTVTCVVTASSQIRNDKVAATSDDGPNSESVTVTKVIAWRNWRK